jgi:hypothetical protein
MEPLPPPDGSATSRIDAAAAAAPDRTTLPAASRSDRFRGDVGQRSQPESLGLGTWDRDLVADTLDWDDGMYRLFGRHLGEAAPRAIFSQQVHAEDRARVRASRAAAVCDGAAYQTEFRIVRPDGEVRWLAMRGAVRRGPQGAPVRLFGVNWDITESRRAEEAVRARETAERASRAKSLFLSRMSEELRTPLNAILGFTQLLERDTAEPLGELQRERVGNIHAAGWHLMRLVSDVLDLTRIETGAASPAMAIVALEPLIAASVSRVLPQLAQLDLRLTQSVSTDAPRHVWADGARLTQVLQNLLTNAIRYNRPRGAIALDVLGRGAEQVVISVRDTGRGMSPAQRAQLFQPFNRLGLESVEPEGAGISLAISQRLVEQMRGSIEVDSEPGSGSTFRVVLNTARVAPAQAESAALAALAASTRPLPARDDITGRVLYIEDHPANSARVEQLLQLRPGITLYKAQDGATGLVLASACRPDLLLIDMRQPDPDGLRLLHQLRQRAETRRVPCVAMSAHAMADDIRAALDGGFTDCWTQPLDAEQFLAAIDRHLSNGPAVATAAPPP